jgi:ribonuclease BN (tRNA processing enzyme)
MKIIFLGTNGWYTSKTGNTPCILIDSIEGYIVFDAGNGIYKLDKYITENKPIDLFISHFHLDHTSGLHILPKFSFSQGIDVYIGKGRKKDFETLVNPPFTVGYLPSPQNIINLKTTIRLHELSEEGESIPFKAKAVEQQHVYINHGFRLELEGKVIAYTGDCGFSDKALKLAENADLLISECSFKKLPDTFSWGHLDPFLAAKLAKEGNAKQLILTHFDPTVYTDLESRQEAEENAKKTFLNTKAATDDLIIIL